jgi:enoyl-CoA hydratase
MTEHLRVEDADRMRTITIDRPDVKNALTQRMRDDLCALLADTDADDAVDVVVLTAVDPVFSAGVDFKEVAGASVAERRGASVAERRGASVAERRSGATPRPRSTIDPGAALRAMTTPVIGAVNGACVTGALEIALSCSFVVASERARFADTHARLGVMATWGLTALLPRAVGLRMATEMSLTGNFVDAVTAQRIGLVNHVVPHDDLLATACAIARDVAPGPAGRAIARVYRDTDGQPFADALRHGLEVAGEVNAGLRPDAFGAAGQAAARRAKG